MLVILSYSPCVLSNTNTVNWTLTSKGGHHRRLSTIWLLLGKSILILFVILAVLMADSDPCCGIGVRDNCGTLITADGYVKLCLSRMRRELPRSQSGWNLGTVFRAMADEGRRWWYHARLGL